MVSPLNRFGQRFGALLTRTPRVKRWLRRGYHRSRDPLGRGMALEVGGTTVTVPACFATAQWHDHEPASMRAATEWLLARSDALLLDIGCSVGLYSALALKTAPRGTAYAFDADLVSLKTTLRLCRHVGQDRLHPIHGLVSDRHESGLDATRATQQTAARIRSPAISDDPDLCGFVCLDGSTHRDTPLHSLDGLFADEPAGRPWMMKCDVEGAELLVLRGATSLVRKHRPQLLISVHDALAGFGFTRADVAQWLRAHGYSCRVLAVDHEEHWWCTPHEGPAA